MLQQSFHPSLADDNTDFIADNRQTSKIDRGRFNEPECQSSGLESLDIFTALDRVEETILNSTRVPLTGKTMVDEEELLEQIDTIRLNLPEIFATAQEILEYRQQIIKEAQQQVQQIVAEANQRAYQVANELGIIERSEEEATQIRQMAIAECEYLRQQTIVELELVRERNLQELEQMRQEIFEECRQIQDGADEYADRVLHNMEYQLADILQSVQRGRQRIDRDANLVRNSQPQLQSQSKPAGAELINVGDRLREIGDS
jgi:vacuolar-type H+-ATPase subunit H